MSIISDCYTSYLENFPDDNSWFPPESANSEQVKEVYDKIESFIEDSFIFLSKSVISGEYIHVPDIKELLKDFIEGITLEYSPLLFNDTDSNKARIYGKYLELNRSLFNALKYYLYFVTLARDKFETSKYSERYGFFKLKEEIPENILTKFVDITIPLCQYDYRFSKSSDDFQNLLTIRADLKECIVRINPRARPIFSLLLHKCHFIIRRIKSVPFTWEAEFDIERIMPQTLDIGDYSAFSSVHECLSEEKLLFEIRKEDFKVKPFVLLMKFYKQNIADEGEIKKMDYVIKRFSEILEEKNKDTYYDDKKLKNAYDRFALNSILNFLHNCRFSCYVQICKPELKKIKHELRRIEDIQNVTGVKNFHPYEKAIEAVLLCVETHLESNYFDDRLISDKFEEVGRLISSYEEACKWSESHRFFPFQLPFDESLFHSEECNLDLFIPSAFARYIDYDELRITLSLFKKKNDELKFFWGLAKERKEVEHLKINIKETDKKAFDLIALFTAAITFLFGIVNVFSADDKIGFSQLIIKTTGLGIFLVLFMCLYLLVSPVLVQRIPFKKYVHAPRFYFGLFGVIVYAGLIFALFFILKTEAVSSNNLSPTELNIKVDSVHAKKNVYNNFVKDGVIIEEVVPAPKMTSSQLYGKTKLFFTKSSDLFEGVIQSEDPDNHIIVGKGRIGKQSDKGLGILYYNFTIAVQARDERYRYTITDVYVDMAGLVPTKEKNEYSDQVAEEKSSIVVPINDYYIEMAPVISLLKEQMQSKESDNW